MNLNSYSAESPFSRKDLMAGGALLAFYLITRITHLTVLPVFNDEAVYLHWAKLIEEDSGNLWISIEADSKKPLLIWLLVLGFKLFHDPLWAGRMVSVAAGMGSLVGIYLVGCRYHSRRVGQLGALLFVFSPYHLFFDRMVYEAALINCFFIWGLWLTLSLVQGGSHLQGLPRVLREDRRYGRGGRFHHRAYPCLRDLACLASQETRLLRKAAHP